MKATKNKKESYFSGLILCIISLGYIYGAAFGFFPIPLSEDKLIVVVCLMSILLVIIGILLGNGASRSGSRYYYLRDVKLYSVIRIHFICQKELERTKKETCFVQMIVSCNLELDNGFILCVRPDNFAEEIMENTNYQLLNDGKFHKI